jgi:hypothetical protein
MEGKNMKIEHTICPLADPETGLVECSSNCQWFINDRCAMYIIAESLTDLPKK